MKYTLKPCEENHQLSHPKPVSCNNTARNTTSPTNSDVSNLCYEPTSVLEIRGSPNPKPTSAVEIPPSSSGIPLSDVVLSDDALPLQWGDHSDDWDKLLTGLGLPDDSVGSRTMPQEAHQLIAPVPELSTQFVDLCAPPFVQADFHSLSDQGSTAGFDLSNVADLHHQHHQAGAAHWNVGFDFVDDLIRAAECVDSNEVPLARAILARLNPRLPPPAAGKPLQRAAFYFKEALQSLLAGSTRPTRASSSEIVQTIRAFKALSEMSPIPMFSHFTANQALLEAFDGSAFIHVVDFDIGLGGKWASFMKEIADRSEVRNLISPVLRITAVVPEEFTAESRLIGDSLSQFAHDLRLGFRIDFVMSRSFDALSFSAIKFIEGERVGVLLSPPRLTATGGGVAGFLANLRRLSPHVVVFVDGEGCADGAAATAPPSFRRSFIAGLEFYSTMLESLDASSGGAGGDDWIRKIEVFLVRPKIFGAVEAAGRRVLPWKEVLAGVGLRAVQLSQFADFQAECLLVLGRARMKGFHVAKCQGEMVLCWNERPLVATSAWRC